MKFLPYRLLLLSAIVFLPSESVLSQSHRPSGLVFKRAIPPVTDAPAGRRKGGASRGICPAAMTALTALAPTQPLPQQVSGEDEIVAVGGLTVAADPILWFYVPGGSQYTAEFGLQTLSEDPLYTLPIPLPIQAGVIGIRLPAEPSLLALNTTRRWHFKIFCDLRQSPILVEGWVQRRPVATQLKQQLTSNPRQSAEIYAENGLWYDALTASLGRITSGEKNQPAVVQIPVLPDGDHWNSLLRSVGLEPLTEILTSP